MKRIKAIIYGVGEMGRLMTRIMIEKDVEIVGAIGNKSNIGKDLGEVCGLGYSLNVKISNDADAVFSSAKADIAVMSFCSDMQAMYMPTKKCIENGVNVISITEEALYPWTTSPEITKELDELAKKHGVTVTGGGIQDINWISLVSVLTGASHTIESVLGRATGNADDFGPVVAGHFHVGETKEEFESKIREQKLEEGFMGIALESVIADLGLTIKQKKQSMESIIAEEDVNSVALGRIIKKGEVLGAAQIDEMTTDEGIDFRAEFIMKVYQESEDDTNIWVIKGYPDLYLKQEKFSGSIMTCTPTINRIPDIINSEPGFITVEKLPKIRFRAHPLHYYLNK
ncbi:MAG: hypothetical protein APF81_15775 [Desulfosporosinus sp. BRH_c37]|nr:MAG: hypothetical protein APF81_15775 [Desulfosporosinus sp. BRH_c37]